MGNFAVATGIATLLNTPSFWRHRPVVGAWGGALMQAIEDRAHDAGKHSMWAGVSGANPEAVHFHTAVGYSVVSRLPQVGFKFGQWIDLILLQKLL